MKKIAYTKEGHEELLKRKNRLETERIDAVKEVSRASEMGDRSENAAYKYGKQKLRNIDRDLRFVNSQLRFAEVVQPRTDGVVGIGSKVVVNDGTEEKEFTLVGGYESDISKGWISQYSPLGKTLFGKNAGTKLSVSTPGGLREYKILKVF